MGRPAGAGDDGAQATRAGALGVGIHFVGHTVRGNDLRFKRHAKLFQNGHRVLHHVPVRRRAHDDADQRLLLQIAHSYAFSFSPVRRSMASKYLAWVLSITSAGSAGAGAVLPQVVSRSEEHTSE